MLYLFESSLKREREKKQEVISLDDDDDGSN